MTLSFLQRPASAVDFPPSATPADRLASHSELLAAWLAEPSAAPRRWRAPHFGRMVDIVRSHLAPINECAVLAHSYGREHFHFNAVGLPPAPRALLARDATEVAYALRYLELLEGTPRSRWAALMSAAQPAA